MAEHPAKRWLKRLAEPLRPRLRPGLFIIGAQKAGTSALFSMLGSHPRILAPQVKEPHFFNSNKAYAKGMREYLDSFPIRPLRGPAPLTLEATVGYLEHPEAAGRLQRHFPEALLVAVLRDPVDRAFSAWNMFRDFAGHPGREHLVEHRSFEQAIDEELSGTAAERARRYLATGHYAPQLERYARALEEGRLLVFGYSIFKERPREVVAQVLSHLGLDPEGVPDRAYIIEANKRPYHATLPTGVRERCEAHCAAWRSEVETALGRPFAY
ncbi:MAG TPA: sulfotransferase [Flavobacteriales bacterium]|nr:sulfotransferase [Flavobacteriales bacterium]MCB0807666.1 sulfotransferase [Flavobacteriales bacterium]HOP45183.1 sulfotransferase [Flavobacteriales bacterium]